MQQLLSCGVFGRQLYKTFFQYLVIVNFFANCLFFCVEFFISLQAFSSSEIIFLLFWKFCRSRNGCSIGINSGCCPNCGSTLGKTFGWCQPLYWTYLFHWVFDKFIQKSLEELNSIYYMLKYFFLILHFLYSIMRVSQMFLLPDADTGKKWTSSKFPGFPISSNISQIFHNVSPIFY